MSDIHQHFQNKMGLITNVIAAAGLPTPIFVSFVDETAKIAAIIYSTLGAIHLIRQMWKGK